MKRKIYLILSCVFALIFIVSSVMLGISLYGYREADVLYEDLQNRFVTPAPKKPAPPSPSVGSDPAAPTVTDEAQTGEQRPSSDPADSDPESPVAVNFEALLRENGDVIGWLYSPGTPINYPVVQTGDNDYYLRRNLYGKNLTAGTLFADFRCAPVGTQQNFIIYGHNMHNSSMFGTLGKYKRQSYYNEHPVLYYLTPEGNYALELFAGITTPADSRVYTPQFGSEDEFDAFLREIRGQSTFRSSVAVDSSDAIVTLSTCSYEFGNARYVVFAKLVPIPD